MKRKQGVIKRAWQKILASASGRGSTLGIPEMVSGYKIPWRSQAKMASKIRPQS